MNSYPIFPFEIELHIINYIDPNYTIIISQVCKKWKKVLDDKYKSIVLNTYIMGFPKKYNLDVNEIQNDSYMFDKYCTLNDPVKIFSNIKINEIYSHKCLNRLAYKILYGLCQDFTIDKFMVEKLVEQYVLTCNTSKPEYLELLFLYLE